MENVIVGCISAFIISFYAMPIIIQVSKMKKLYDVPNDRKIHATPIPSLGGLGIYIGFIFSLLMNADITPVIKEFQYFLACFTVVLIFGTKDDILILLPFKKFLGQLIIAAIVILKAGLYITSFHGFATLTHIPTTLAYFITGLTIVVIMNAFNLIDGVDGLAGSVGIVSTLTFALFFHLSGDHFYALLAFVFCASLVAFLIFNYSPAKIFMGDTGAMMLGLINAILVIRFINTAETVNLLPNASSPAMGFGILMIPLLDTLRVFGIRMMHGRSPFSPDRNHLHHQLLDKGMTHRGVALSISGFSILGILLTYWALPLGCTTVIALQVVVFFTANFILHQIKDKQKGVATA